MRTRARFSFTRLGYSWTHWAEIWYVVGNPLAVRFKQVKGGAQLHARIPFPYLGTAGRILLKLGVWLGNGSITYIFMHFQ